MKRMLAMLLMIIMALPLLSAAASAAGLQVAAASPIRLGGTGDDNISRGNVLPLSNGNLLLSIQTHRGRSGMAETGRFNTWTWLICLKPDGSTLWETELGEEQGSMIFGRLTEQPDQTVMGYVDYSIMQHGQYRQKRTYSLKDGSLVWQGEREPTDDQDIYISIDTAGSCYLRTETHDAQASCEPRFYQLEEADGTVVWRVEDGDIGLNHCDGALHMPQGTLLYGNQWDDGASGGVGKALLIDQQGNVIWSVATDDLYDSRLMYGLASDNGRVLLAGLNDGRPLDPERPLSGYRERLLLLMDTATGTVLWRRLDRAVQEVSNPFHTQLETEQGFLLADKYPDSSGFDFQLIGLEGSEGKHWQTAFKDTAVSIPYLFCWNGEIWAEYTIDEDGRMDVIMERLAIPE